MRDIDNYTESAINSKLNFACDVWQYSREQHDGVVCIKYYVGYSWATVGISFIPAFGTGFALGAAIGTAMNSWNYHYFNADTGEIISESQANDLRQQTRNNNEANSLNSQGLELWNQGKYAEAAEKFSAAYNKCTSGYSDEQTFKDNVNHAKAQVLNDEGNKLHNAKKYSEAINKYQQAYDICPGSRNRDTYKNNEANSLNGQKYNQAYSKYNSNQYSFNRDKAKTEVDAINLNLQGDTLFNQGKYSEAYDKYNQAYSKYNSSQYSSNRDKAKIEVDAINLNSQGDSLFNQGKYSEAQSKYQEACDKSQVSNNHNKYSTNRDKAKTEIDAINLNSQGDSLFNQGKYVEAQSKYQEAFSKSSVTKEKKIYEDNKLKVQTVINKLSELEALWNNAWAAESDEIEDRSAEAQELFQKVLEVSKQALKFAPNSLEIKKYIEKSTSKIEGNKNFNLGLNLEEIANNLLQEAQNLKEKGKFSHAKEKFFESKEKYSIALKCFEQGNKHDHRFKENLDFVQNQINEVNNSLKEISSNNITLDLDINFNIEHQDGYQLDVAGNHNYFEQI